ncbi:MAG TPA: glycogen synthase, partial [candidate division Zixibacteria bacterium]|nr:glycogen synthase [candidate division Zixibacteria bacterium]
DEPADQVRRFFVEEPEYYDRDSIYVDPDTGCDYADNDLRYGFLSRGLVAWIGQSEWRPDIVHLNDWQTAPAAAFLKRMRSHDPASAAVRTILTIHNLAYQGLFPPQRIGNLGLTPEEFFPQSTFEWQGQIGLLKAGLVTADRINTVSAAYAEEIQTAPEYGLGLEAIFRERAGVLTGILNGIDEDVWNPAADPHITARYTSDELSGKAEDKADLCARCGFAPARCELPLLSIVTRLVDQKGIDLLVAIADDLFAADANLVILGTGERRFHEVFERWNAHHPDRFHAFLTFDDALAHQIEAGADIFLMPSKYEPCGLNQMYSLRYGTIPVVRATGGLRDTVRDADADPPTGNGFVFTAYEPAAFWDAIRRTLAAYRDRPRWAALMAHGMASDFSWQRSANAYRVL